MHYQIQNLSMFQKSVSLPKIKEAKQQQGDKSKTHRKILKQSHKTRWSMAPKCLIEGHDGKDVIYICINPSCEESTRLVCEACFFKTHQKHNQQFLAIDEIKLGQIDKLRFWPFEQKYRRMADFITKHDSYVSNMIQDVNATFNGMTIRITNSIDQIRLGLLKKIDSFYVKERSTKLDFCNIVKSQLQKCFQLKRIQTSVRQIFCKEIGHDSFLDRMKIILNDSEIARKRLILSDYFETAEKGKDMLFDKMNFLKKENWIIQQIQQQTIHLKQTEATADLELGIQQILPQTLHCLEKYAEGWYPLTLDKKIMEDGSEYIGFLSKGIKTMFGTRRYKNGYTYYGEWKIDIKNGWGIYQHKSHGYKYQGYWKDDKRHGYGRQVTLTSIYEGNFVGNKKQGFGIFVENGIRYEISWKDDKKHGTGKRIQQNGVQQQIYFIHGIQESAKSNKTSPAFELKQLVKRFTIKPVVQGSVKST